MNYLVCIQNDSLLSYAEIEIPKTIQHLIFYRHIYGNNNEKQNRSIIFVHLLIANSLYCNMAHILRRSLLSHLPSNHSLGVRHRAMRKQKL